MSLALMFSLPASAVVPICLLRLWHNLLNGISIIYSSTSFNDIEQNITLSCGSRKTCGIGSVKCRYCNEFWTQWYHRFVQLWK